jgi:hypothetical protein
MNRERQPKVAYSNPRTIVDRYKAGETEGLTWAIREYIYLSIKARAAFGEDYYENPNCIAAKFGAQTQSVHDAVRGDSIVIRTGTDGDQKRVWVVCNKKKDAEESARRKAIKSRYKVPKSVGHPCGKRRLTGNASPAENAGVSAANAGEVPPQSVCGERRASEHIQNAPPEEETIRTRPEGGGVPSNVSKTEEAIRTGTGTGTGTGPKRPLQTVPLRIVSAVREKALAVQAAIPKGRIPADLAQVLSEYGISLVYARLHRLVGGKAAEAAVLAAVAEIADDESELKDVLYRSMYNRPVESLDKMSPADVRMYAAVAARVPQHVAHNCRYESGTYHCNPVDAWARLVLVGGATLTTVVPAAVPAAQVVSEPVMEVAS